MGFGSKSTKLFKIFVKNHKTWFFRGSQKRKESSDPQQRRLPDRPGNNCRASWTLRRYQLDFWSVLGIVTASFIQTWQRHREVSSKGPNWIFKRLQTFFNFWGSNSGESYIFDNCCSFMVHRLKNPHRFIVVIFWVSSSSSFLSKV